MKVKFAVVGCGHIGRRHADLIHQHPNAELVATIDVLGFANLQISDFKVPHFNLLEDFLKSGIEVDVVNICTPNGFHAEQAIQCLESKKHVVIEKPIALNIQDANLILDAATKANRHVFPVVQNRYSPTIKWLKEIVLESRLGEIFMVQLNCFWNRDERYYTNGSWRGTLSLDGGPLFTQFSHFIDVLNWVFGDITNISTRFSNFSHQNNTEFEDTGVVSFDLVKGGVGAINYSTAVYQSNFESSITVIAEKGTVKIGGQYMNSLDYCQIIGLDQPVLDKSEFFNDYGSYKGSASNHQQVIDNVVRSLKGLEPTDVSLQEGIDVVGVISNIYQSRNIEEFVLGKSRLV